MIDNNSGKKPSVLRTYKVEYWKEGGRYTVFIPALSSKEAKGRVIETYCPGMIKSVSIEEDRR